MSLNDGFMPVGKGGKHKYIEPIIKNTPPIKVALAAWVLIKEFMGIYKIDGREIKHIYLISRLSSITIETAMRDASLLKYSTLLSSSNYSPINYKKRFLYLIGNGCKNKKLYILLKEAAVKLEERLLQKEKNLQLFKDKYVIHKNFKVKHINQIYIYNI